MSANSSRSRLFERRSKAFQRQLEERQTNEFVADLKALKAGPTSFDAPPVDEDAPTELLPAIRVEPEALTPVPAAAQDAPTEMIGAVNDPRQIWFPASVPAAIPDTLLAWTEQDARVRGAQALEQVGAVIEEREPEQLPAPRRRHTAAIGVWLADRMRPVPHAAPAIPDAATAGAVPLREAMDADRAEQLAARTAESSRLALEAAASTAAFDQHRPDDFVEWLRWEFAEIDRRLADAVAEHAQAADTDRHHFTHAYFNGAQHVFDELNAMTLPGWTAAETALATDLYQTGAFA